MTSEPVGPESTSPVSTLQAGDIFYPVRVTLFISLLCTGYVLSRPSPAASTRKELLLRETSGTSPPDRDWSGLPPWQKEASRKAASNYANVQEKKWRRWNDAMFERSD